MDELIIGALDIGGTKIAACIANAGGPLARSVQPTVKCGTVDALPEQAIALLEAVCRDAGVDPARLQAVGVSTCGPFVDDGGMRALSTPNICGGGKGRSDLPNDWLVVPLEKVLRKRFAQLAVEIDVVAALVGERTFGAVQDAADCIYVTWSTGIGFGLCVDGRILHGKNGNAGHAGHMLMSASSQALCGCGNLGDLEALISGRNVGASLGKPAPEVFAAAAAGDPVAGRIATEAAQWFGRALYNLAITLDTGVFVVGGSVWMHHGHWLAPIVTREIASRLPALTGGVTLVSSALEGLVSDIGAFSLVMPQEWIAAWRKSQPWRALSALPRSA